MAAPTLYRLNFNRCSAGLQINRRSSQSDDFDTWREETARQRDEGTAAAPSVCSEAVNKFEDLNKGQVLQTGPSRWASDLSSGRSSSADVFFSLCAEADNVHSDCGHFSPKQNTKNASLHETTHSDIAAAAAPQGQHGLHAARRCHIRGRVRSQAPGR